MYEFAVVLNDQVSGPAAKMGEATSDFASSMGKMKNATSVAIAGMTASFKSLAAGDIQGSIQGATEAFAGLASTLDLVVPGLGQAASTIIKVGGTIAAVFGGLIQQGMALAIAQNELKSQLLTTFDALGEGPGAGKKTLDMLNQLSGTLPQTREQLAAWAKQYEALGVTDLGQLQSQLKATAAAQALMGDSGATAFQNIQKKILTVVQTGGQLKIPTKGLGSLAEAGLTVDDVAKRMGVSAQVLGAQLANGSVDAKKFGNALTEAITQKGAGALDNMAGDLSTLKAKFTENISKMFEDVDIGPLMTELKSFFDIFSQANPSGQALKTGITGAFNQIFKIAAAVVPYIKTFLLDLIIWGLKAYIFFKSHWDTIATVFKGIAIAIGVVAAVIVAALAIVAAPFLIAIAVSLALYAAIGWLIGAAVDLGATVAKAVGGALDALSEFASGGIQAAEDFISGLVGGITGGIAKVADAAKSVAKGALGAVTGFLGISSPSKVMMEMGVHTTGGLAQGIKAGTDDVQQASTAMAKAITDGAASGSSTPDAGFSPKSYGSSSNAESLGGKSTGASSITIDVGGIHIDGAGKSAESITEQMVSLIFERVALTQGL